MRDKPYGYSAIGDLLCRSRTVRSPDCWINRRGSGSIPCLRGTRIHRHPRASSHQRQSRVLGSLELLEKVRSALGWRLFEERGLPVGRHYPSATR